MNGTMFFSLPCSSRIMAELQNLNQAGGRVAGVMGQGAQCQR